MRIQDLDYMGSMWGRKMICSGVAKKTLLSMRAEIASSVPFHKNKT